MNIRNVVKLNFALVIVLLLFLGLTSVLITYQIKENSNFRESTSAILITQEGMNDIILESIKTTEAAKLEQLHSEFITYEKRFEDLREMLSESKKLSLINHLGIPRIQKDKTIKKYLDDLYDNEQRLEVMYDDIFQQEREKVDYVTVFNVLYPKENSARIVIKERILQNNRIEQIKALSDLRYYSKEMLYQHGDEATLQKWLTPIDILINATKDETDLNENLLHYKEIVRVIAEKAMKIEETKIIENATINKASEVLDNNKHVSIALEEAISELSSIFIDQMRFIQLSIGFVTIIFILILAFKVTRNVSLTMDEVEAKIDEGLEAVNALNQEIEDTQKEVIFTMGSIGETRSQETGNHVKRVAEYTKILALYCGLDEEEAEMLKLASPMHDIGKIAIPDRVLNKPGRFDEEEREIMNTHAMIGYEMLKHSQRQLLKMAAIVAREHHERYDGTGYPDKKSGEDIHIYGRITALADVFDALGSPRIYKSAWDDEKIFALFREERGKQFDPKIVDIFFEHLEVFLDVRETLKD